MPSSSKLQIFSASTSMQPLSFWSVPSMTSELAERIGTAERFVELRTNDHVNDAGFVFEGQEDEALGGAGPLSRDNEPSDATRASRRKIGKTGGRYDAQLAQTRAKMFHQLAGRCNAGRPQIERREPLGRDGFEANGAVRQRPSARRARRALRVRRCRATPTSLRVAKRTMAQRRRRWRDSRAFRVASCVRLREIEHVGERALSAIAASSRFRCASPNPRTRWKPKRSEPPDSTCDQYSLALTSIGLIVTPWRRASLTSTSVE